MKKFLLIILLFCSGYAVATESKNEWQSTSLTEALIKTIQQAQQEYKACVMQEMQKPVYQQQDSRNATEIIIKTCEPTLAEMRTKYLKADVPAIIADRHLKKMRIQTTRKLLQELMFQEAARQAG